MRRRFIASISAVMLVLSVVLVLSSCGDEKPDDRETSATTAKVGLQTGEYDPSVDNISWDDFVN